MRSTPGRFGKIGHIIALARRIKTERRVGLVSQFVGMGYLFLTRRVGPLLYFEAGLWRDDIPMAEKRRFLTGAHYQTFVDRINPAPYRKIFQHKLAEKSFLKLLGFPTVAFFGFYHERGGCDARGEPLDTLAALSELLRSCPADRVCFKLAEGWGGAGFSAARLERRGRQLRLASLDEPDEALTVDAFFDRHLAENAADGLLIEEYLTQHPTLATLHPASVNTLRIIALQKRSGVDVLGVALRVGRGGQIVDNAARGGLIAEIDLDSGELIHLRDTGILPTFYPRHPDSGAAIAGVSIPYWPACLGLAKRVVTAFPHLNFVGIDMAIGENGPVIIELNPVPAFTGYRIYKAPAAQLLDPR